MGGCGGWPIDIAWRQVSEMLVWPPVVVASEPGVEPSMQVEDRDVFLEIDFLVFDAAPQPLDEDVVHPASAAVHADLDAETEHD